MLSIVRHKQVYKLVTIQYFTMTAEYLRNYISVNMDLKIQEGILFEYFVFLFTSSMLPTDILIL